MKFSSREKFMFGMLIVTVLFAIARVVACEIAAK